MTGTNGAVAELVYAVNLGRVLVGILGAGNPKTHRYIGSCRPRAEGSHTGSIPVCPTKFRR